MDERIRDLLPRKFTSLEYVIFPKSEWANVVFYPGVTPAGTGIFSNSWAIYI